MSDHATETLTPHGRAMGAEPSESSSPEVEIEASSEPTNGAKKKKRGRPPKAPKSSPPVMPDEAVRVLRPDEMHGVVVDPRQLALLAGEGTPRAVDAAALRVVLLDGFGEGLLRHARALEATADEYRRRASDELLDGFHVERIACLNACTDALGRAGTLRRAHADLLRALAGLGVRA